MPKSRRSGYTLLEMMLVLAIIVLLAGLTYPALDDYYRGLRTQAAVDSVKAGWTRARIRAIDDGRPYRFAIVPGENQFRIAPDDPRYWTGTSAGVGQEAIAPLIVEENLPKGVLFALEGEPVLDDSADTRAEFLPASEVSSDKWVPIVAFAPDGTADKDVEIVFSNKGTKPRILSLRALTCVATVRREQKQGTGP